MTVQLGKKQGFMEQHICMDVDRFAVNLIPVLWMQEKTQNFVEKQLYCLGSFIKDINVVVTSIKALYYFCYVKSDFHHGCKQFVVIKRKL